MIIGPGITIGGGIYVDSQIGGGGGGGNSPVDVGTQVAWSSNTYFDSWTSQSGVTTTDAGSLDTNNLVWQMFYAHVALTLRSSSGTRYGINPRLNGTNTISCRAAISSVANTIGSFAADTQYGTGSGAYTSGVLREFAFTSTLNIPADRYFLLGIVSGPFYRCFKTLAANRTATIGGSNIVTVFNKFWHGAWPSGPTTGIPTQLGGAATFTEISGYMPVTSFKFETA